MWTLTLRHLSQKCQVPDDQPKRVSITVTPFIDHLLQVGERVSARWSTMQGNVSHQRGRDYYTPPDGTGKGVSYQYRGPNDVGNQPQVRRAAEDVSYQYHGPRSTHTQPSSTGARLSSRRASAFLKTFDISRPRYTRNTS